MNITTGSHYLAYVLDEETRNMLFVKFHKQHEVCVCHHITIQFKIKEEDIDRLQIFVDSSPQFEINDLVISKRVSFFNVLVNGSELPTDGSFAHLTFTRIKEASAVESNHVIKGTTSIENVIKANVAINGQFELVPYKRN